jgi:hypothetical protein
MTYLILHKVRGEPAFDIADKLQIGDEEGWIIPTSGHRAYPYLHWDMNDLFDGSDINKDGFHNKPIDLIESCPSDLPDHYQCEVGSAPKPNLNIMSLISNLLPKMKDRRF